MVATALVAGGQRWRQHLWPFAAGFADEGPIDPKIAGKALAPGEAVPKGMGILTYLVPGPTRRMAIRTAGMAHGPLIWFTDDPEPGSEYRIALWPGYYTLQSYPSPDDPTSDTFIVRDGRDPDEWNAGRELPAIAPADPALAPVVLGADDPVPPGASVIRYTVQHPIVRLVLRLLSADRAIVWHADRPAYGTFQLVLPPGPYSFEQHAPVQGPWTVPPRVIFDVMLGPHERENLTSLDVSPVN
jgi:hypothetical protein